ncbi:Glycyl-tRNA synthetase [Spironucleus salmonicida]|uniref:glycine--tRNA ligase n=1 Tax=Spironucleus salmonicida TaxID=348837 RepID=V6LQR6_9EUKA|nr:Glycyl-tRNA synthetase [Spironucleus salmonicida]|eukprot:EST46925.1 Glycyl-tRNA synthetase [Spironucleus salmonicida]
MQNTLVRRFIVAPSFEIYGGVAGLFDLGPVGCQLRHNIIDLWRNMFVVEDDLFEIQCTNLVPEVVLKASGHIAKFADLMVKDSKTGECFRADKIIEQFLEKLAEAEKNEEAKNKIQIDINSADGLNIQDTAALIAKYNIVSERGNPLSEPFPFNLMFATSIGPDGRAPAYLRPETAQGIFMNFKRGLEQSRSLPFGIAQIGSAFRNEIAPRGGLLRVREFEQAEIEYFIQNREAGHPHYKEIEDVSCNFFTSDAQLAGTQPVVLTIKEAVTQKVLAHESLAYYIARIYMFLTRLGLDSQKLRFRQHMPKQLAHYAKDCWDCDCLLNSGWTEIVGVADRSAFDLEVHSKASGQDLSAFIQYDTPVEVEQAKCKAVMKFIAKAHKQNAQGIKKYLEESDMNVILQIKTELENNQKTIVQGCEITPEMCEFTVGKCMKYGENVIPIVIEPSIGIGRVLHCILEHTFYQRDEQRTSFKFPIAISPIKLGITTLQNDDRINPIAQKLVRECRKAGIMCKQDDSAVAIGKKYARFDEIGVSYVATIDFDTLEDKKVTIRERDSMQQERVNLDQLIQTLLNKIKE